MAIQKSEELSILLRVPYHSYETLFYISDPFETMYFMLQNSIRWKEIRRPYGQEPSRVSKFRGGDYTKLASA